MILLSDGGLLMDTPGMRELQFWDVDEGVEETFSDIEELAILPLPGLRARPGAGLRGAGGGGGRALAARRLESYQKLRRELQVLAARQDRQNRLYEKRRVSAATKAFNKHAPRR